jgi:hypothetical protein
MSDPSALSLVEPDGQRRELSVLLGELIDGLPKLSNEIAARYLIHTGITQELTGRLDSARPH